MKIINFALIACLALLFVTGCGQKGSLYLPEPVKNKRVQ